MLTAALLSSYAAIDAAFWADVDSRVGAAATPWFRQYCAQFRDAWAAEAPLGLAGAAGVGFGRGGNSEKMFLIALAP